MTNVPMFAWFTEDLTRQYFTKPALAQTLSIFEWLECKKDYVTFCIRSRKDPVFSIHSLQFLLSIPDLKLITHKRLISAKIGDHVKMQRIARNRHLFVKRLTSLEIEDCTKNKQGSILNTFDRCPVAISSFST
jgi:hypothetical protein